MLFSFAQIYFLKFIFFGLPPFLRSSWLYIFPGACFRSNFHSRWFTVFFLADSLLWYALFFDFQVRGHLIHLFPAFLALKYSIYAGSFFLSMSRRRLLTRVAYRKFVRRCTYTPRTGWIRLADERSEMKMGECKHYRWVECGKSNQYFYESEFWEVMINTSHDVKPKNETVCQYLNWPCPNLISQTWFLICQYSKTVAIRWDSIGHIGRIRSSLGWNCDNSSSMSVLIGFFKNL